MPGILTDGNICVADIIIFEVWYYLTDEGRSPFSDWFSSLGPASAVRDERREKWH